MFLTKASESDIANKVKADSYWLTEERLQYILEKKSAVFHYLNPENINKDFLKGLLKKEKFLLNFASVVKGNESWKNIVDESIPRPLTNVIFKEYGVLLKFVEEKEYEGLAKDWLKKAKPNEYIPAQIEKLLDENQILNLLKNRTSLGFKNISEEVKTKKVCLAFMEAHNTYVRGNLYKSLPKEMQDDGEISLLACAGNKQFYHELTPKAKLHEKVVCYVINSYIPPAGDHDTSHTDHTAIKVKQLSIEAILSISSAYTIRDILKINPQLFTNKQIQEKWLSNKKYQEELLEHYNYFSQENKENFNKKLKTLDNWKKASILLTVPKLKNLIIDESNVKASLEILYASHMNTGKFEKALTVTGLKVVMDNNLKEYSSQYGNGSDPNYEKRKILDISDWLVRQKNNEYKQVALELLSIVLKKDPNALDVDFEYHYNMKSRALKDIASEVYEYMDNNKIETKAKKKKM